MGKTSFIFFLTVLFIFSNPEQEGFPKDSFIAKSYPKARFSSHDRIIRFKFYNKVVSINLENDLLTSSIVFISLHDNEVTAQHVVESYLKKYPHATFIHVKNSQRRLITFSYRMHKYIFDPNRIFTAKGIQRTLNLYGSYSKDAASKIRRFAALLLDQLSRGDVVIAFHNNTDGRYSILSYCRGAKLSLNAEKIYISPKADPDDFFFTTSASMFKALKAKEFNVVLQDNQHVSDDGSLSVYYRNKDKTYINIEAQKGHFAQQRKMLYALMSVL